MSRSVVDVALASLVVLVCVVAGLAITYFVAATPLPDVPQAGATRETKSVTNKEISERLGQIVTQLKEEANPGDFHQLIADAALLVLGSDKGLMEEFTAPNLGNAQQVNQFKNQIAQIQMNLGLVQFKLDSMLDELDNVKALRAREPKEWQTNFDYVCAHLAARIAHVYEYNAQLGQMRKELPPLDATKETGWRLVSRETITDRDAAKYAKRAQTLLAGIAKNHAGGEWERHAKEEIIFVGTGLRWVAIPAK